MYGAILGDIIGSRFEFDRGGKTKEFDLFTQESTWTDDTVLTVAVADALMKEGPDAVISKISGHVRHSLRKWGRKYPNAGFGGRFYKWLFTKGAGPYNSYGNGSAMRTSAVGWLYDSLERTREVAAAAAAVTHNHPEGIKGAECTAAVIYMARTGVPKDEIRDYVIREFGYDLSESLEQLRARHEHVESCQDSLPKALTAFFEGTSYEDVVRNAVSLGGDTDTLGAIAGAMGEAMYGVPENLRKECRARVTSEMREVLDRFDKEMAKRDTSFHDMFLDGNELIDEAIERYCAEHSKDNLVAVLDVIRKRMHADGHLIFPIERNESEKGSFAFRLVQTEDGRWWNAAFTSKAEFDKGAPSEVLSFFIDRAMQFCLETKAEGIIINPWGQPFLLTNELIRKIFEADGDVEYSVPDTQITWELLEDGSFLKKATEICNRNRTQLNLIKLARILRDSLVWIPCNAVMSDADYEAWTKIIMEKDDQGELKSLEGMTLKNQDDIRLIPDILQNGEDFFFPVFTTDDEMGEYGQRFSKIQKHFLEAANLARNNERDVAGIVINAFSEPFVVPKEMFDVIAGMESSLGEEE